MQLAREGILQQGGAASPTIEINNYGALVTWEKNGVSQGSVAFSITVTLTAGDTFRVTADNPFDMGVTIDYFLNGSFVTSYFDFTTAQTPTITSAAGNAYKFDCYGGA